MKRRKLGERERERTEQKKERRDLVQIL